MENNTKTCPKCGNGCCIGDLYCIKCSYKFSNEKTQKQERKKKVDEYSNDIKNDTSNETLDVSLVLEISPEEAINGTTKTITVDYDYNKELDIEIPPNVVEGTKLCLKSQGYSNNKGESGDLYVIIKIVDEFENLQDSINIPNWLNSLLSFINPKYKYNKNTKADYFEINMETLDEIMSPQDKKMILDITPKEAKNGANKQIIIDSKVINIDIPPNAANGFFTEISDVVNIDKNGKLYVICRIIKKSNNSYSSFDENSFENSNESENLQNQINIPSWLNILFIIITILFVGLKAYISYKNVHGSSTQNKIQKQTEQLPLACDDENIKNSVIQNFKSNDKMYSAIDSSTIADIDLIYPSQINYDQSSDTYYCKGVIILKSADNGFKASYETMKNDYYNLIYQYNEHNGEEKLSKNTRYEYDIEYKSYLSNNKPAVTITSDYNRIGEFSCSGNCEPEILKFANKEPQYDYNSPSYENNYQNYNYSDYSYSDSYSDTTSPNNNLANNSNSEISSNANTVNNTKGEPDFEPFMKNLQEKIKRNWNPPQANSAQSVVVKMKIAKDGQLISLNIIKSSGVQIVDNAAMYAVRASAPFSPLPADCTEPSVDVEFTFDYNVR